MNDLTQIITMFALIFNSFYAQIHPTKWYDVPKLSHAVCMQETKCGEKGVGKTYNNVCGIRYNNKWARYKTKEEGLKDCQRVLEKYRGWTIRQMSRRYTMTQQNEWESNVTKFYYQ